MEIFQNVLRFIPAIFLIIPVALILAVIISAVAMPVGAIGGSIMRLIGISTGKPKETPAESMTCSIDADCPEGYLCIGGRCIQIQNR